jgi:hypothetical protein
MEGASERFAIHAPEPTIAVREMHRSGSRHAGRERVFVAYAETRLGPAGVELLCLVQAESEISDNAHFRRPGAPCTASSLPREGGESVTRTRCASRSESRSRSVAASSVRHGWFTPIAATAPSWPLRSMRGSLSPTAAEATKRTRSPIAPGSVRLPGGG